MTFRLATLLRAHGAPSATEHLIAATGDRWFPAYGLGNFSGALKGAAEAVARRGQQARPRPVPRTPPPPPPPDPDAIKEVGDAILDAADGATRAYPDERAEGALEAVAEGSAKGAVASGIARAIVPGDGPIAKLNEQAIAPLIERLIDHVPWRPTPPRATPARPAPTSAELRDRHLAEWSDPYLPVNEQARSEGREATPKERLEFEQLPEEQWQSRGRHARYDYSHKRASEAFRAAQRREADPQQDPEYLFWNDRRAHDLQALRDADARSRAGR